MSDAVTHRQIAQAAQVCQSTVSLALRNHPKISPEVRSRVQRVAEELGYRPNAAVAALMSHIRAAHTPSPQGTLGFVFTQNRPDAAQRDNTLRHYFAGAQARARDRGYTLEPCWLTAPGMSEARMARILLSRGIRGLIFAPLAFDAPERLRSGKIALAQDDAFASAALGRTLVGPEIDRACHDNYGAMLALLQEVRARGYQRIGFAIDYRVDERVNHLWLAGYLAFAHECQSLESVPPLMAHQWEAREFMNWFETHRPDAVVTMGFEPLGWLQEEGYQAPRDVGLATVSWLPYKAAYAGNYHNYERIGAEAVDLVINRLLRNDYGPPDDPRTALVKGRWVEGPSLAPRPAAASVREAEVPAYAVGSA